MKLISNLSRSFKQKHLGNTILSVTAIALLSISTSSCRGLSTNVGSGGGLFGNDGHAFVTCAASSTSIANNGGLSLLDPDLGGNELAQSFVPQGTVKNVSSVTLGLQLSSNATTSLTGNLSVTIVGSLPSGLPNLSDPQSVAGVVSASTVTKTAKAVTFPLGGSIPQLTANTTYWILLGGNFQWSSSTHVVWLGADNNPYPNGHALAYNGSNMWINPDQTATNTANNRDLSFQLGCL